MRQASLDPTVGVGQGRKSSTGFSDPNSIPDLEDP